jgi:hypothetical protein
VANETQIKEGLIGMRITRLNAVAGVMTFLLSVALTPARAQTNVSPTEARAIAEDVYIYGYPLVTLEMTRRVTTNTAAPAGMRAPMGQFAHARKYPPITYRDIPGANADTLYSSAWLDLAQEPYVLKIPDAEGRYFMVPMLDGWTDVFQAPGTRTTGDKSQTYVITGPRWKGELPKGVTQYKSATNMVWIVGRTYSTGTDEDYKKVHSFQDKLALIPLSEYGKGKDYTPPSGKVDPNVDVKTPTKEQVIKMDAATYFKLLATQLKDNPPTPADAPMVVQMAKIGLVPGKDWDISMLDPAIAEGVATAPKAALAKIMAHAPNAGKMVSGWQITLPAGVYGTNYLQRALLNLQGPGWNRPEDAVYPIARVDGEGKPLSGAHSYVVHFAKGEEPPVKGFWSLTMYDAEGFFVPNPLDRVNLSQRDKFNLNGDGSLDLYIQKDSPGKDKEANWLPSPDGDFGIMLRLYWPNEKAPSILDGSWTPPAVRAVR